MDPLSQETLDLFWKRAEPRGAVLQDEVCISSDTPYGAQTHGGCGRTRVAWSYEGEEGEHGAVVVCAVGDCAYLMPRFL